MGNLKSVFKSLEKENSKKFNVWNKKKKLTTSSNDCYIKIVRMKKQNKTTCF